MFDNYKAFVRKDIPFILVMPETFLWNGELRFATLYYEYEKMTLEQAFLFQNYYECGSWFLSCLPENVETYIRFNGRNVV